MMRHLDPGEHVVLIDVLALPAMEKYLHDAQLEEWLGPVAIFICPRRWVPFNDVNSPLIVRRFFDRFYLYIPVGDQVREQRLVDTLFAIVAPTYDGMIHRERNLRNIRLLLEQLCGLRDSKSSRLRLFDIGCGTGLAVDVASEFSVELLGIERSPEMRSIAQSRGMIVLDPDELRRYSGAPLDGAFASYVFHLSVDQDVLFNTWRNLHIGSGLSANFHKGAGFEETTEILTQLGARILVDQPHSTSMEHGLYATYLKVR